MLAVAKQPFEWKRANCETRSVMKKKIEMPVVNTIQTTDQTIDELYEIGSDYRRFNEAMHMNIRRVWDPQWKKGRTTQRKTRKQRIEKGIQGYSIEDYALLDAAGFVSGSLGGHAGSFVINYDFAFKHTAPAATAPHLQDLAPRNEKVTRVNVDPEIMSFRVKQVAKFCGASDVGICEFDRRWVYDPRWNPDTNKADIPADQDLGEEYRYVIVLLGAMEKKFIKFSPTALSSAATEMGYAMMGFTAASVAAFIRRLGYKAIPSGNDTALSIPYAIMAGLGELGRHGLLIHPKFGTMVRLAKVFTDLPLKIDKPIKFGAFEYCLNCSLCADVCPAQCISNGEPTTEIPNDAAAPGMKKWYIDSKSCRDFWDRNGSDCSNCVKACPYGYDNEGEYTGRARVSQWWGEGLHPQARVSREDLLEDEAPTRDLSKRES